MSHGRCLRVPTPLKIPEGVRYVGPPLSLCTYRLPHCPGHTLLRTGRTDRTASERRVPRSRQGVYCSPRRRRRASLQGDMSAIRNHAGGQTCLNRVSGLSNPSASDEPIPDSRFPIIDSRFPIIDSRFPIPDSRLSIPDEIPRCMRSALRAQNEYTKLTAGRPSAMPTPNESRKVGAPL